MKRILGVCAAVLAAARLAAAATQVPVPHASVIYGPDDRVDVYQAENAKLRSLADSTVALFNSGNVQIQDATAQLTTRSFGEEMHLCQEEPFFSQPTGAFCSGSLVAPDVIMTAGHCVTSAESCAGVKFVFGFSVKKKDQMPTSVPAGDVYGCKELIGREQVNDGADWALIRLDRKVAGHEPLKLNLTGKIEKGAPVVVIGHPAGLPTKIAGGANVRDSSKPGYFTANLDTYGGNSGSAVFNGLTGLVEGILVRGEQDYVEKGDCRVSNVCENDACRGEDVTKIANVSDKIPAAEHEARVAALQPTIERTLALLTAGAR